MVLGASGCIPNYHVNFYGQLCRPAPNASNMTTSFQDAADESCDTNDETPPSAPAREVATDAGTIDAPSEQNHNLIRDVSSGRTGGQVESGSRHKVQVLAGPDVEHHVGQLALRQAHQPAQQQEDEERPQPQLRCIVARLVDQEEFIILYKDEHIKRQARRPPSPPRSSRLQRFEDAIYQQGVPADGGRQVRDPRWLSSLLLANFTGDPLKRFGRGRLRRRLPRTSVKFQ